MLVLLDMVIEGNAVESLNSNSLKSLSLSPGVPVLTPGSAGLA